jgi:hypothetical protein
MNDRYTPAAMSALSHLEQARESASAARRAGGEAMSKELIELLREARHLISDGYGAQLYGEPYLSDALDRIDAALAQPAAQAVPLDCRTCAYFTKTCGCMSSVQCVNGDRFVATRPHQYWKAAPEGK